MRQDTLKAIAALYDQMDSSWNQVARKYNFQCNGCEENCCRSLFFHHTYIEKAYLLKGFNALEPALKKEMADRADHYIKKTIKDNSASESLKIMCPANTDGQCMLYEFRPMICRLHGLPHEISRPGFPPQRGEGCAAGNFKDQPYIPFDRTNFYREMARLEMGYREEESLSGKLKQTIAQMLLSP